MTLEAFYSVERVNKDSLSETIAFLRRHENYTLFLLGNLEAHGHKLTSAPNSGNFKLVRYKEKIVAVFSLIRRGNLVVQSELSEKFLMEKILIACHEEQLPILGLIGEWDFCRCLWNLFKEKAIILNENFISKELLYTVDLSKQNISNEPNVRLLVPDDYLQWEPLRIDYLKEEGLPNDLSEKQLHEQFIEKVQTKVSWGYFLETQLVAIAELNAKALDLGQVGGVYTKPEFRKRGFAKSIMHQLIEDAKKMHQIRKLIIFTGESNSPARRLYESLGVRHVGYYALMFGNNTTQNSGSN